MALANSHKFSLFLFTLITEIPYTKHSSSSLPPALEQRDPLQGNTDLSCSFGNTVSQGTTFLFFLFCLFLSEQHWEYIQRVGVYCKCKCFLLHRETVGKADGNGKQRDSTAPRSRLPRNTWRASTHLRDSGSQTLPFAMEPLQSGSRKELGGSQGHFQCRIQKIMYK